ncbi:hypothetical protein NEPAR05_0094 [Nematocida parisii]|nr:hypothetical protein NEPAR05_0094 [Nematocida parisii]
MSIEIKDLKGLTEHKTSTINTLNASVSNSNLTCDNLNQKIKTMEEDAQKINSQLQENKEKIDTLATEIDDKKNTICKLNTKINEMQTMIDKKNTTNNENDLEIRNLKTKIENLNKDLIKETTRANCAEKNLNTCNDNQVKLQEEIKNLSATIFTNESKNTDVEKQIKVLKENKNTLESSLKTAEKTIKETDKELKENKKTIENLEKSVNDLKETIKTKLTECNNEKTKINNLNKDHKQLIEELSEYKKKIDLSNNQEKSYKEKNTELEKALKEKNTGLDELKCEKENIEKKLDALNDKYNKVYNEHTDLNKNYTHLTKKFDDLEKVLEQKENELLSVKKESTKSENELNNTIKTLQTQFNNEKDKTDKMNTRILNLNNDLNNTRKTLESTQNHLNATNDKLAQLEKEKDQLEEETLNKLEEKANNEKSIPDSIEFIDIQNENMESKVFLSAEDAEVRKFKDMSADKKMKIVYDEILEIQNSLVVEEKHKLVWHHFLLFNTEIMPANSSDVINIGPVSMDPTNWISHLIRHNMMYKEQAAKISYCYFKEYNPNSILNVYKQLPKIYKNDTNKKPHAIVLENMVRYCTTLHEFLELTSKFIFLETDTLSKLANDQYQSLLDAKKLNRMGTKHTWSSEMQKHFKDTYNVLLDLYNNWTIIQQNRKQIGREMADSDEKTHTATSSSNEEPILDKYISLDEAVSSLDVFVTHKTPKFKDFKGNFPNTEVIGKTLNFTRTSDMLDGSNRWDLLDQAIRECSQFLSKSNSSSLGNSENQRPSKNIDLMFILFSARPDIKTSFSPLFFLDRSKLIGIVAAILNRLEDCLADFKALTQDTKIYNSILENDLALIQTVRVSMAIHSAAALLQHNILSFQRSKDHFIYNFVYKNLFATSNASVKMIDDSDKNEKNVFKSEMARIINVNPKDLNKTNRKTETRHDPKYIESKIAVKPFGQSQNSEYPEFVWNLIKENAVVDYYLNYSMDHIKKYASSKNMKH